MYSRPLLLLFASGSLLCFGTKFDLNAIRSIVRVADPQISPDGRNVVVVVSEANYDANKWDGRLVMVDVASGTKHTLTRDRQSVSAPQWSPVGDRLAFLAQPAGGGKAQIFVMPMTGGDTWQLTRSATGVQQYSWSPDGSRISYVAEDERPKKEGEERHNDSFEVGNNDFLATAAPMPSHLWVISTDGGAARRLTSGAWTLPITHPPSSPASPASWAPDGKSIAIVKTADPHSGDANKTTILILDVESGSTRPLTGRAQDESQPVFSPDGKRIAFWFPREGVNKNVNEIQVAPVGGGEGVSLTRALDRNLTRAIWMPDGKSLLVGGNDGTKTGLWVQPLDGPAHRVELGDVVISGSFWVDLSISRGGALAFTGSEPRRPGELYFMESASGSVKRLTNFNEKTASLELGKTESVEWDCPDHFRCDGVITYPPGFEAGTKYPLVLYVHGGPRAASKAAFSSRAQLLAAQGWVVFEPNYRGSDNRGNAFQAAISNDAGDGPGRDVMSGVDVLKKRGFVDSSRMAVSGWSYGGYMTTWLLGHYPVWKAAVAGAAVTDWIDQYTLGDANVRRASAFGGSPYTGNRMAAYIEQSPITAAVNIKAPTLVLSDTGDYRVTVTQSYKLYRVLKDNGVTTQFIAYPIGGHSPTDPVRQRDIDRRWIDWLTRYL